MDCRKIMVVMLQGFYWDSYQDSKWTNLETQAKDLAAYFNLVWLPQSAQARNTPSMGYDDYYWCSNYNSSFGNEAELLSLIGTFKANGINTIADVVINHRATTAGWFDFPTETYNNVTYTMTSEDVAKNDDGEWSSPFFVNYTSGSIGLQLGYSSADMVILFKNSEAYANLFNAKDTISLKAEATGGVGNEVAITSDLPEISAFAEERGKTSGAFVGVSLDVARLKINIQDTNDYYERMYDFENIYNNSPKASKYTLKFKEIISKYFL